MELKAHTLLRYPGGKTRAVKHIVPLLEATGTKALVSPFFGGGAIELNLINKGWLVTGYDAWDPVVNFWQRVSSSPGRVADLVGMFRPVSNSAYSAMQKNYDSIRCPWTKAAVFYTLNRCVHTGTGLSGGKTNWGDGNPRLTDSTVDRLRHFKADNLIIDKADFADSIERHPEALLYLDPPYVDVGKTLYDHSKQGFDHERLASQLRGRSNWILSYNDHTEVRRLYRGHTVLTPSWQYGIKRNTSNELLILSPDLAYLKKLT